MRLLFLFFWLSGFMSVSTAQNCYTPMNPSVNGITPVVATVNWDAMPNATAYEVNYRPTNAPSTLPWTTLSANTNSVNLTGLTPSTMYSAQIRSVCGQDFSNYTVNVDFSTQSCVPPGGISASNLTANTADLQWNVAQGASGYQLLYRVAVTNPGAWNSIPVSGTSYQLTGLTANTLYAARLLSDCGGNLSDTSKVYYFSINPCSVPSHLMITAQTASSISLTWDAVANATQYNVQYRLIGNNTWSNVNSNTNDKTINGLSGNSLYEFQVRSRCSQNEYSAYTLPVNGFTLPCAMPENAVVSNVTVNSVIVGWNNAVGSTQYRVEYKKEVDPNWTTVNANNTTKTINNLDPDTDYQVRVRSKCTGNQYSAYSELIKFRTKTCVMPAEFAIVDVNAHSATVNWRPAENAIRYQLDYRPNNGSWSTITTTDTFRTFNNFVQNEVYQIRLRSQCGNGVFSGYVDTVYVVLRECLTPSNPIIDTVTYGTISLRWDTASFATQYRLQYKALNDSAWQQRTTNQTQLQINQLVHGQDYLAVLTSRCGNNLYSSPSNTMRFSTLRCETPLALFTDSIGYTFINLSWQDNGAESYKLEYCSLSETTWTEISSTNNSRRIGNLAPNTIYKVKIRSKCEAGVFSDFSGIYFIKTLDCQAPLPVMIDTISPNQIRLRWNPVPNVNRYVLDYKPETDSIWNTRNVNDTSFVLNISGHPVWSFRLKSRCSSQLISDAFMFAVPSIPSGPSAPLPCSLGVGRVAPCGRLNLPYSYVTTSGSPHFIAIQDMNGNIISTSPLTLTTGNGTINIDLNSPPYSQLQPGTYSVCVTVRSTLPDNAPQNLQWCSFCFGPFCLPIQSAMNITALANPNPVCSGGTVTLTALSQNACNNAGLSYRWTGAGILGDGSGSTVQARPIFSPATYTVQVSDLNTLCTNTATVTIQNGPNLSIGCPTRACRGTTVNFTATWSNPQAILTARIESPSTSDKLTTVTNAPTSRIFSLTPSSLNTYVIEFNLQEPGNLCVTTRRCTLTT